jgi:hypothetical protein
MTLLVLMAGRTGAARTGHANAHKTAAVVQFVKVIDGLLLLYASCCRNVVMLRKTLKNRHDTAAPPPQLSRIHEVGI